MSTLNFNASDVEPNLGFEAIPAGKYQAIITDSEMRDTKTGNGQYLWLEFEIIGGDHKGRKLWSRLNLDNPNPDAVRMARADLSAICHAVKVMNPHDSSELHNLPLTITVRCRKNPDDEIVNEIRGFGPREGAVSAPAAAAMPTQQATVNNATAPWARGR